MSLLHFRGLSQSFGDIDIFSGLSASIDPGVRIGMVGPNGVGKTTLLRILAGRAQASAGKVSKARNTTIGYLPQEAAQAFADSQNTVQDEMLAVFADLRKEEKVLRAMEEEMAAGGGSAPSTTDSNDSDLLERYSARQARFEQAGGYDYEVRIKRILSGLGFDDAGRDVPLSQLSGGQKTRALLARLLLQAPELLVLDEPTNHLDVQAVEWLEGTLGKWPGAVLVVSHDRFFLDRVASVIWEMSESQIEAYRGNYTAYTGQREARWDLRRKRYDDMMARFEKEMDYIRRNIAGQRTQMAKGKLSRLGREVEAVHLGGLDMVDRIKSKGWAQATAGFVLPRASDKPNEIARRIGEIRPPLDLRPQISLRLKPAKRGGDFVLRSKDLVIGYSEPLFEAENIELMQGERVALIGGNGTGKTTFLRTLLGKIPVLAGELKLGANQDIGYFAQAHESLKPDETVIDAVVEQTDLLPAPARGHLAGFGFSNDEVFARISSLSGGERGRLALSILARADANLLLLDEPTNHLDIPAQEVLEDALLNFKGTLLLVSHDRYLVRRLATQVWSVDDDGHMRIYTYGYEDYLAATSAGASKSEQRVASAKGKGRPQDSGQSSASANGSTAAAGQPSQAKLSKNELRRRKMQLEQIELRVAELEEEMGELQVALQNASESGDFEAIQSLGAEHSGLEDELNEQMERWADIGSEIE